MGHLLKLSNGLADFLNDPYLDDVRHGGKTRWLLIKQDAQGSVEIGFASLTRSDGQPMDDKTLFDEKSMSVMSFAINLPALFAKIPKHDE